MATIQDVFSHIYTTEANLSSIAVEHGQIILCTDSGKLYIDHGSNRVSISDVVQVETQTALPLAPLDKFYITRDTGDVYFYINDEWKKLTDTSIDLSNYSQNTSIRLTSTAGAVDLISNTGEVGLYSGNTAHIKANVDTVDLKATTVSLNGHAQNTAGGFAVVDVETAKLPASIIPEQTNIDLSDAVLRYPATVDTESKVVTITDGTPVEDVRIGDEIVTADGVYKKTKDSITTRSPANGTRTEVSGNTGAAEANGGYILTETENVWKNESADYWILLWNDYWFIADTRNPLYPGMSFFYASGSSSGMPL